MKETIDTIIQWHSQMFPDATLKDQMDKYEEERKEIYASAVFPNKVDEKMAKNRKRTWEKTQYGNYHHTNTED